MIKMRKRSCFTALQCALLPEGTVVLGMNIKEGTIIVDFNEKFLEYEDKIERDKYYLLLLYMH